VRRRDLLLGVAIVLIWGANFVAIDRGLTRLAPLLFVAIRFLFTAVPAVFLVPRPQVGWRNVVALGLLMCVGQFGLLFVGIAHGMPAGLASVVIQCQAIFTVVIGGLVLRERPRRVQFAGLVVAVAGLGLIAAARGSHVPLSALGLVIAGAACWGGANVVSRASRCQRPFSLLVYSSLVAPVPLVALSLLLEGPARDWRSVHQLDATVLWSLVYIVVLATLLGFGGWYWLLGRYPASTIAPLGLLVPASGMTSAWALLGQRPTALQLVGAAIAVIGVGLVVAGAARKGPLSRATDAVPSTAHP
jgi:O-acetylserine/cysteine efflux transporter